MKKVFTLSENAREEYCCSICRVGEVTPIENSDFLAQTVVGGFNIVVRKYEIHEGDVVLYAKNETVLNEKYLSSNNLFEISEREKNANAKEVCEFVDSGKTDEAKKMVGFFNKHGRVKMLKLRGCPSMGYIFTLDSLVKWDKRLEGVNLEEYIEKTDDGIEIPYNFDTVNGELFVKVYIPPVKHVNTPGSGRMQKRNKRLKRFNRIIPGTFSFHYDTKQLNDNFWRIGPDTDVEISVKLHWTSAIFANIPVNQKINLIPAKAWWNKRIKKNIKKANKGLVNLKKDKKTKVLNEMTFLSSKLFPETKVEYGNVYSSRGVIKNQYINVGVSGGFYGTDVWGYVNNLIKPYIEKDMTVYGEIVGYVPGSQSMIQKGYDYGCKVGECKFMPYRIVTVKGDKKIEWSVSDVYKWTMKLISDNESLVGKIIPIVMVYNGKLSDRYSNVSTGEHWHENVLELMKNDFGLEENEPLCVNKIPREGVCIRIKDDPMSECFKLKAKAFLLKEGKNVDSGNVNIEMTEGY